MNSPIILEELEVGCMTELGMMGQKQCQSNLISRQCCLYKMGIAMEYITARLELLNSNSSVFQISLRFPTPIQVYVLCVSKTIVKINSSEAGSHLQRDKTIEDGW